MPATETRTSPRFSEAGGAVAITCTALAPGAMCTQVQPDRPRTAVARAASGRWRIGRLRAVRDTAWWAGRPESGKPPGARPQDGNSGAKPRPRHARLQGGPWVYRPPHTTPTPHPTP